MAGSAVGLTELALHAMRSALDDGQQAEGYATAAAFTFVAYTVLGLLGAGVMSLLQFGRDGRWLSTPRVLGFVVAVSGLMTAQRILGGGVAALFVLLVASYGLFQLTNQLAARFSLLRSRWLLSMPAVLWGVAAVSLYSLDRDASPVGRHPKRPASCW